MEDNGQMRALTQEELDESIRLSEFAFQYELTPEERQERLAATRPGETWGYFAGDQLAAKMSVLPLRVWLGGRQAAMGGVASVAAWPEFRRQGLVGKLLVQSLGRMKESGFSISCLHPFEVSFYRKYGWELYVDYKKYELSPRQLPVLPAQPGYVERTADPQLLDGVYETFAARYNGMLVRDEAWWNKRVLKSKKGLAAVYRTESGEPRGYILYQVKNYEMTVHELVHLDDQARRGLWKFIANHDSMANKVIWKAPADDELPFLLADPRIKQEQIPYFMARIVDAEAFVRQLPFAATGSRTTLNWDLHDPHAAWNNGSFTLIVEPDGAAKLTRRSPQDRVPAPCLASGMQAMAAMLLGYKRPVFLAATGLVTGDEEAVSRLESLLPRTATYLADYY